MAASTYELPILTTLWRGISAYSYYVIIPKQAVSGTDVGYGAIIIIPFITRILRACNLDEWKDLGYSCVRVFFSHFVLNVYYTHTHTHVRMLSRHTLQRNIIWNIHFVVCKYYCVTYVPIIYTRGTTCTRYSEYSYTSVYKYIRVLCTAWRVQQKGIRDLLALTYIYIV